MRATPFRTVLEQVLGLCGQPFDINRTDQLAQAANFINLRVQEWWDHNPWPELLNHEERAFAADYYSSRTYGLGDVVWHAATEKYYEALQTTQGNAVTDATYWEETDTPEALLIAWEQYGENKMGRVWNVYTADPRTSRTARKLDFVQTADGIVVPWAAQQTVWVVFTKPASQYTATLYQESTTYDRYDLVFYPGSETSTAFPDRGVVYQVELDTNNAYFWQLVPFPAFLAPGLVHLAASDMLRNQGQKELAERYEAFGQNRLLDEWDKVRPATAASITGVGG
jgi:hypothetical protein